MKICGQIRRSIRIPCQLLMKQRHDIAKCSVKGTNSRSITTMDKLKVRVTHIKSQVTDTRYDENSYEVLPKSFHYI